MYSKHIKYYLVLNELFELEKYYKGWSSKVFSRCTEKYRPGLLWYLNLFRDIYDYCSSVYLIDDKSFVNRLIESGKNPLNDRNSVLCYMALAQDYWKMRGVRLAACGVDLY